MTDTARELPDLVAILGSLLSRVERGEQPLLVAMLERLAAERYRSWAEQSDGQAFAGEFLECARREDEIADRIEALHPDAVGVQQRIRDDNPNIAEINRGLFMGRPLREQAAIQAQAERLGAATWQGFAQSVGADTQAAATIASCAELEERNAAVLDDVVARMGGG